jgi:hypothetical protein
VLGWRHRTTFADLVREMVEADLAQVRIDRRNGHSDAIARWRSA